MIRETVNADRTDAESEKKIKVEIPFDTSSENDSLLKQDLVAEEEESHSSNNSPSPTISMESQMISSDETKKESMSPSSITPSRPDLTMGTSSDENPILNILRDSINRNGMNDQSRELLFQLGRHLMNLASENDNGLATKNLTTTATSTSKTAMATSSGDEEGSAKSPYTRGNQKYSAFYKKTKASPDAKAAEASLPVPNGILSAKNIHETYFQCSCNEEFENLYIFTIHMRDTGHKPKASSAEKDIPKLVRGQDMWINSETEQTKEILRCMHCQQSFRSLPDLTMHMIKTNHYSEIVYQDGNIIKNGADSANGRNGTKKVTPEKNSLKRKSERMNAKDDSPERKTSKAVLRGLEAKKNGENPLSSLQKLVNIQNDEKVNGKRLSPLHNVAEPPKSSFLDLFYQLEQIKNYDPQTEERGRLNETALERKPNQHSSANVTQTASLTKKAKCHFCGKPFANKGQVRLHISKNKCPSLLQKNCQNPVPIKTAVKRSSDADKSSADVQFTNPHLNAAFNLLQRQFPDESKQTEAAGKREKAEQDLLKAKPNGQEKSEVANPLMANLNQFSQFMALFQMLMPHGNGNPFDTQQGSVFSSLLPLLAMNGHSKSSPLSMAQSSMDQSSHAANSPFPFFPFQLHNLSSVQQQMTNPGSDFSLDRYLALARQLAGEDEHIVSK